MIHCSVVSISANGILGDEVELKQFNLECAHEYLRTNVYRTDGCAPKTEVWMDGAFRFIKISDVYEGVHVFSYEQRG